MATCKDCLFYEVCADSAEKFIDAFTSGMELSSACLNFKERKKWVEKKEPVTNADRIRAMNDEELAVFLEKSTGGCETCAVDCTCNGPEDLPAKAVCHQGVLKWLQSPAEKEGE